MLHAAFEISCNGYGALYETCEIICNTDEELRVKRVKSFVMDRWRFRYIGVFHFLLFTSPTLYIKRKRQREREGRERVKNRVWEFSIQHVCMFIKCRVWIIRLMHNFNRINKNKTSGHRPC